MVFSMVATLPRGRSSLAGPGDIDIEELFRIQAVRPADLGDDLVAAAGDVETVDEIASEHGRQVRAYLLEVEAEIRDLVAVDDDLGPGLVDFDVDDGREGEHAAIHGLDLDLAGELQDRVRLRRGRQEKLDRELPAARQGRRRHGEHPDARNAGEFSLNLRKDLENGAVALLPGLEDHAAEAGCGTGDLEGELGFRHAQKNLVGGRGIPAVLIEGRIGRRIEDAEDDSLVLGRRQFHRRHDEHGNGEKACDDPDRIDRRAGVEGRIEQLSVEESQPVEAPGNYSGEARGSSIPGLSSFADIMGDRVRATMPEMVTAPGQGEREFPEERAGEPALEADGRVDRRQGDRHGDDGTNQLAGAQKSGVRGRLSLAQVPSRRFPPRRWHRRRRVRPRAR